MTAREQAREAAQDKAAYNINEALAVGADAASDVWEPLLRSAYEALRRVVGSTFPGEHLEATVAEIERINEALGGT